MPDHLLEVGDDRRERVRPERAPEEVVALDRIGDPGAHRLVDRVLERLLAVLDLDHPRAEQLHPQQVGPLPGRVDGAHVDRALEAEQRARRRRGHAVLPRARLGEDPRLAHALGEQRLAEGVVELVRAGVEQVFALQPHVDAESLREAARRRERRGAAGVVAQQRGELALEVSVLAEREPGALQLLERGHQRLGAKTPPKAPKRVGAERLMIRSPEALRARRARRRRRARGP